MKPGFKVGEAHYEWPTKFELGDTILVERLTGMDFQSWAELLEDEERPSVAKMVGLVAASIRQAHPSWSIGRVEKYVLAIDMSKFEAEVEEEPPTPRGSKRAKAASSPASPEASTVEPEED